MILVTGATGAVGPRVVQALRLAGHPVRTLSLNDPGPGEVRDGVEIRLGDVTDPSVVAAAMQGIQGVVHLAALVHVMRPTREIREESERVNIGGTATVINAALAADVSRVVLFSTISVYGRSGGQILTEETPPQPDTPYGETKLRAEQIVLGAVRADGVPLGTVLRMGAVYGSRIKGNYRTLMTLLHLRRFIPIGDGKNRRTLVYDRDAARAAVVALEHPRAAGQLYNVTDGEFHTMNEIVAVLCDALGRQPPRFALPLGPVRATATFVDRAGRFLGVESTFTREMLNKYTEDIAVEGRRIQIELGFSPEYELMAGWSETIREMRAESRL